MINFDAEHMHDAARQVLSRIDVIRMLCTRSMDRVARDREIASYFNEPLLDQALAFNERQDWCEKVNCYGYAVGTIRDWEATSDNGWFLMWGELSRGFCTKEFVRALPDKHRYKYLLLADGPIPVRIKEADTLPAERRIIAACDEHFFMRVKPGLWVHKAGKNPVALGFGSQPIITNIYKAVGEHIESFHEANQVWGYFEVPSDRLSLGATQAPIYCEAAISAFYEMIGERIVTDSRPFVRTAAKEMKALGVSEDPDIESIFSIRKHIMDATGLRRDLINFRRASRKFPTSECD